MNPQRSYYFLRQKLEALDVTAKEQNIKEKEFAFRELVLRETQKLNQIKHDIEVEHLQHDLDLDRKLHNEEVKMLNILHENENICIDIEHKQELYKTDKELQHSKHLNEIITSKNGILKEQNVLENKRGQLKDEKYQILEKMNQYREEYWDKNQDLTTREAELNYNEHLQKIDRGIFDAQTERQTTKLENWKSELYQRSDNLEMKEERSLLEVDFREREVELKEKVLEKSRNMHLTVYKSEKARLKFWREVSDILEVRSDAIDEFNYYTDRNDELKSENKNLFGKNILLKNENMNERRIKEQLKKGEE